MIGVTNIVNAIENFLPPPASVITRHVSNILGIFVGGGPNSEDIVKKEFQQLQMGVDEQFRKQKRILSGRFENNSEIKSFEYQDLKEFLENNEFFGALTRIKAQIDAFDGRLEFLSRDHKYQEDQVLSLSVQDIRFILETDEILEIKENLENACFDTGLMKVNQTLLRNQFCTDLLYTYISLNQLRDLILASFVNKAYRSEELRGLALYVLDVNKRRKADLKKWLEDKIVENDSLSCPLFITRKHFWTDPVRELRVKSFIQNIDNNVMAALNRLDAGQCEQC